MGFDARKAKSLQDGEHIVVDDCPGLRLVAGKKKRTWIYRFKSPINGNMKQTRLGDWPAMDLGDAVTAWKAAQGQRNAGVDLAMEKKHAKYVTRDAPDAGYTLGQLVEDYAREYLAKHREPKGAHAVALRLRKATAKHSGMLTSRVGRQFVFDLLSDLADTPVAARSVKNELASATTHAASAGRIPNDTPNWWAEKLLLKFRSKGAVREGKHKGTGKRVLSDAEFKTLFTTDLDIFSQQVQDFLTIQAWTCARGGEIAQMRVEQITEETDGLWWTLPKELIKLKHVAAAVDQRVPLEGRARAIVVRLMTEAKHGWLFPSRTRRGEWTYTKQPYMQSKVHYYQPYSNCRPDHDKRRRLTVTHWSPHDLRRTGRTTLAAMGCPHEVGEAILAHLMPGVAGAYNRHTYDREKREWLKRLADRLELLCSEA